MPCLEGSSAFTGTRDPLGILAQFGSADSYACCWQDDSEWTFYVRNKLTSPDGSSEDEWFSGTFVPSDADEFGTVQFEGTYHYEIRNAANTVVDSGESSMLCSLNLHTYNYTVTSSLDPINIAWSAKFSGGDYGGSGVSNCLGHVGSFWADDRTETTGSLCEVELEIAMVNPQPSCSSVIDPLQGSPAPSFPFYGGLTL